MFNFLSGGAVDSLEPYAKWISVGLLAVFLVALAVFLFEKNELLKRVLKYYGLALTFYSLIVGAIMLGANIYDNLSKDYLIVFVPIAVTLILVLASVATVYILKKKSKESTFSEPTEDNCGEEFSAARRLTDRDVKRVIYILSAICLVSLLTTLVLIAVYYSSQDEKIADFKNVMLYVSALILIGFIGTAVVLSKDDSSLGTKEISRAGICIALSFALSYVKLFSLAKGGSVTLASMLPIMMFAYIYGVRKGVFVGLIYGMLQSLQDPWLIHPAQFLLDYPIAFSALGLAGILKDYDLKEPLKIFFGVLAGGVARYVSHVLSGIFAFDSSLWFSLGYNLYVIVDLAIVMAVGIFLLQNKNFKKLLKP